MSKPTKTESLGRELKRVAAGEVARARSALVRKKAGGIEGVHEARQSFKKIRGLLRLVRCGLGREVFERENIFFRDEGRRIREARDGQALIEALDALGRDGFAGEPPEIVRALRRRLSVESRRLARGMAAGGEFAQAARSLKAELERVKAWELDDFTWKDARAAWQRARKACRRASRTALVKPTDENLHEWRKRAKHLWHETLLLRKGLPGAREEIVHLRALTDVLGTDHDLALLRCEALARRKALGLPHEVKVLMATLSAERKRLQKEAFALAERHGY